MILNTENNQCQGGCVYSRSMSQPYPRHCVKCGRVETVQADTDNAGSAIGSTEPTVEDKAHYTPEMQALAERDKQTTPSGLIFVCDKHHVPSCGVHNVLMTMRGPHKAIMECGYTGTGVFPNMLSDTPEDKATWTPEQWAIWTWDEWSRGGSVFTDVVAQAIRGYAEAQAEKQKDGGGE